MRAVDAYLEGLDWAAGLFKARLLSLTAILFGAIVVGNVSLFWVYDHPQGMINAQRFSIAMTVFIFGFVFAALPLIYVARKIEDRD